MVRRDRHPRRRLDPEERREAILEAARLAFAEAPYDQVALSRVAADADASEALVLKYFGNKARLYTTVVEQAIEDLSARQREALAAIPPDATPGDRLRVALDVYFDHIASHPSGWAAPLLPVHSEPHEAAAVRAKARSEYVQRLRQLLAAPRGREYDYALRAFYGFLDAACLHWVGVGCPPADRGIIASAAIGALQGALGDIGSDQRAQTVEGPSASADTPY
ncbi:TetR/AcrR family transcriptional regulator [Sinomonas terrae]|uniref:TetR/AcrR family transcriptional regulator n=1 Tax=Sinomonas terrae TaxID=2908838 RepID=A0ABS9U0N6_9MICC|nr:TetR/AcrR family transcriptional regulator [Sinomonas terrae]MCH6470244.1 TetR/AcrR family transcriptional regulator [Sinomonas terrae]